jgi:ABC-type transporter lipoprotein component MlaA
VGRFLLNTTVGVAGFVDIATRVGLEESDADNKLSAFMARGLDPTSSYRYCRR